MPLDIMLPFYGRMDHAKDAVESIRGQTDPDWRLVVIDDAYPDDSLGPWLAAFGDRRIEYLRNPLNAGIGANFQKSIDLATADHLVIMGGDDVMKPGFVAWAHGLLSTYPDADLLHPGSEVIDGDGNLVRTLTDTAKAFYRPRVHGATVLRGQALATNLVRGNWMNFPAIVWRRDTIAPLGFDQRYSVVQDLALALEVIIRGGCLVLDNDVEFQYRRHAGSVSSWRAAEGSRFTEEAAFFAAMSDTFTATGWSGAARAARRRLSSRINALTRIPAALKHQDRRGVMILLRHAIL